jgi:hypothetical protein
MKKIIGFALLAWLLCGLIGARIHDADKVTLTQIALGPITLYHALLEHPMKERERPVS